MYRYILRRLLLLPITLFCIILVNFLIINLAPGEPVTITEISPEGAANRREGMSMAFGSDMRYLQFREFYGLTLPVLFNTWPTISKNTVKSNLWILDHHKKSPEASEEMDVKSYDDLRITFGDQARFVMPILLEIMEDPRESAGIRRLAVHFFIRGGTRQAYIGPHITKEQKIYNQKISNDNSFLNSQMISTEDSPEALQNKVVALKGWYEENAVNYQLDPSFLQKIKLFFFETRFYRYMSHVLTLDFGTLRNDSNKTVISEVVKRFKYSLTLAVLPMMMTFVFCQIFGFIMAIKQHESVDMILNFIFLILYAIPIFVVAPFLIEEVALNRYFPFTDISIPISGFTSPDDIYDQETSLQRIFDVLRHICLPLIAIMYGSLAADARLSRTAVIEVMRQDYVRTAQAKGVPRFKVLFKHIGRNASITIVTSIAGSLGIVLGGSLIVETIFGIDGFGKFFYDAVINRDYNVIMFSALASSLLTLIGYLISDVAYTLLDPRITLE